MLAGVMRVVLASVETEWWLITRDIVACGEELERLDGYGSGAAKYVGRGVSSVCMGSPSGTTSPRFC